MSFRYDIDKAENQNQNQVQHRAVIFLSEREKQRRARCWCGVQTLAVTEGLTLYAKELFLDQFEFLNDY